MRPQIRAPRQMAQGAEIPIEERPAEEMCCVTVEGRSHRVAPEIAVWNPAFDVTPALLITGILTDRGLIAKRLWAAKWMEGEPGMPRRSRVRGGGLRETPAQGVNARAPPF